MVPAKPVHHHPSLPIVILDGYKLSKMFYSAAWWIAEAESSHFTHESAFSDDPASRFIAYFNHSQLMSVDDNPVQVSARADAIATDMIHNFLILMNSRDPAAAKVYAATIHVQQLAAQGRVAALYKRASVHNSSVAQRASATAHVLSDVFIVCEVAFFVGVCVLSLGAAGAIPMFMAGTTTAVTQTAAATVLPLAYNCALHSVIEEPTKEKVTGIGVSFASELTANRMEHSKKAAEDRILDKTETLKRARKTVGELNIKLARDNNFFKRGMLQAEKAWAGHTAARSAAQLAQAEKVKSVMHAGGNAVAVITAGLELVEAFKRLEERRKEMGDI